MRKANIVTGVFLIVFGTFVLIQAGTYATMGVQIEFFGPAFFPRILSVSLILAAGMLIINALRGKSLRRTERINWHGFGRLVLALLVAVVYWAAIDETGFLIGTPIFLFVLMAVLGARNWPVMIVTAIAAPVVLWVVFEYFLVISLPPSDLLYSLFGEG